jgi:hypothetical protein
MTQRHPISLRLSTSFEDFLREIGPNQSALIRALALLGADAAGYDLTSAQRDLHAALKDDLPPPVASALLTIVARGQPGDQARRFVPTDIPRTERTGAGAPDTRATATSAAPTTDAEHDPFASVGFSFD